MKQPENRLALDEYHDTWYCDLHADHGIILCEDYVTTIGTGRSRLTALRKGRKRLQRLMRDIDKMIEKEGQANERM